MRFPAIPTKRILGAAAGLVLASGAAAAAAAAEPITVLVAYHSQTGNTEKLAKAVAEGVGESEDAEAVVRKVGEVTKADLERADAIILGSPVHIGDVAVEVRTAIISWSMDLGFWESRGLTDKAAAVFVTGGAPSNGKEFTMWSMAQSLVQLGMVLVTPFGTMGASATTGGSDPGVGEFEERYARQLGKRVADVARKLRD